MNDNVYHGARVATRLNLSVRFRSDWNLEILVFEKRGKPEYPEKNLQEQGERTNDKLNLYMASAMGYEPGPNQSAGGECSHHCATLSPPVLFRNGSNLCFVNLSIFFILTTNKIVT